jgi:hypothetical protein
MGSLIEEMKAVARGERPAPSDAAEPSFESIAVVLGLLTPDNVGCLPRSATASQNRLPNWHS